MWFPSDGHSLKEIQLFSMVLIRWVTALPIYLSLALCLPTGHCEKQITLDSEARTQDEFPLLTLNPSLCTAYNVAFNFSLGNLVPHSPPINDKALRVKQKISLWWQLSNKEIIGRFHSPTVDIDNKNQLCLLLPEFLKATVVYISNVTVFHNLLLFSQLGFVLKQTISF